MKKLFLSLCLAASVSAIAAAAPKTPTMWEIVNSPIAQKAEPLLKSIKMVFNLSGKDVPDTQMMFRANRNGQFRIDALSKGASYAVGGSPEKIWCWDTAKGEHKMNAEELENLESDIALLPIPFIKRTFFHNPVKEKPEYVQGLLCNVWKANDKSGKYTVRLWVDQKNSLLRKVESDLKGSVLVVLYENYRIFNGVEMASTIRQIDSKGNTWTMELQSLQWNIKFAEKIFVMPKKGELLTLEKEMLRNREKKEEAAKKAAHETLVMKSNGTLSMNKKIQLEKRIGKLEIEIQTLEEQKNNMETLYSKNRQGAIGLSTDIANNRSGYWYNRGFRYYNTSGRTSTMKRQIRQMDRQNRDIEREYEKISRSIVEKKIELNNAKIDLKNMK